MTQARDNQKQRLYNAEAAAASRFGDYWVQTIANVDLQPWVDATMNRAAIQSRWPRAYRVIKVHLTHGGGHQSGNGIWLGKNARNSWVILHEIAHRLMGAGDSEWAIHGPEFAGIFLFLVRTRIGEKEGKALLEEFKTHRVRHNMDGVPKAGSAKVVTAAERAERTRRASALRDVENTSETVRLEAADVIRSAVRRGLYGPAGCKPRVHALETARRLERG